MAPIGIAIIGGGIFVKTEHVVRDFVQPPSPEY